MSDAIKELLEALGNAPITFDMHRNVTVCCGCGARCDQGWEACMPGSFLSDGRRLCDACAEAPPSWPSVMAREKREMALAFKTHFLHGELAARKALWLGHGHTHALYGDDGEMQCAKCLIDFKRMTPAEIEERFQWIAAGRLMTNEERLALLKNWDNGEEKP